MIRAGAQNVNRFIQRLHAARVGILLSDRDNGPLYHSTIFIIWFLTERVHSDLPNRKRWFFFEFNNLRFQNQSFIRGPRQAAAVSSVISQQKCFAQAQIINPGGEFTFSDQIDGAGIAAGHHPRADMKFFLDFFCPIAEHRQIIMLWNNGSVTSKIYGDTVEFQMFQR